MMRTMFHLLKYALFGIYLKLFPAERNKKKLQQSHTFPFGPTCSPATKDKKVRAVNHSIFTPKKIGDRSMKMVGFMKLFLFLYVLATASSNYPGDNLMDI